MKNKYLFTPFLLFLLVDSLLAACSDDSAWRNDPVVQAAREACKSPSGVDYDCIERQAVTTLNPDICRLAGIGIDDMCLQAVYEEANTPTICDRIYLQGVVPNCRAYYAQHTPALVSLGGTLETPTLTQIPSPTFAPPPTASPTGQPTPTLSPTPLFIFDLTRYDPDLFQPVVVEHQPPLIAQSDETVLLAFNVINTIYCAELQRNCRLEPTLYYTYGEAEVYQTTPLRKEVVHEMEDLVARLPATDQAGKSLRYYAEFAVPEAGYAIRYPTAGTIDLFATANFVSIELPTETTMQPGDEVYDFFWGSGPDKVRSTFYSSYGHRAGPPAMDIASDGRIALMDPVNERIIIFDLDEGSYTGLPLPFTYHFSSNLAFDREDRLMVCDFHGEEDQISRVTIPFCYRLLPGGDLDVAAPLYAKFPEKITRDHQVLDWFDTRLVLPISSDGEANDRETQRQKLSWTFPYRFVEGERGLDPFTARFADVKEGLGYVVHCETGLGGIRGFEKTPQGYLMTFQSGYEQIRAVWIDLEGNILKDVTLPNGQYSEMSFDGQAAVSEDGSLYVLSSTERGIEIHYAVAPQN